MTLQNRVTPYGDLVAVQERGAWMGNRGCLHDAQRQVVRRSARDAWVLCRLQWKGIRRTLMSPGRYTELFFLDEATALAAGHRPCNDCRAERLESFKQAWSKGVDGLPGGRVLVSRIDAGIKQERAGTKAARELPVVPLSELPAGVMVEPLGQPGIALLHWAGGLRRWSPAGYTECVSFAPDGLVRLVTPSSIAKVIGAGFVPEVHPSAGA